MSTTSMKVEHIECDYREPDKKGIVWWRSKHDVPAKKLAPSTIMSYEDIAGNRKFASKEGILFSLVVAVACIVVLGLFYIVNLFAHYAENGNDFLIAIAVISPLPFVPHLFSRKPFMRKGLFSISFSGVTADRTMFDTFTLRSTPEWKRDRILLDNPLTEQEKLTLKREASSVGMESAITRLTRHFYLDRIHRDGVLMATNDFGANPDVVDNDLYDVVTGYLDAADEVSVSLMGSLTDYMSQVAKFQRAQVLSSLTTISDAAQGRLSDERESILSQRENLIEEFKRARADMEYLFQERNDEQVLSALD